MEIVSLLLAGGEGKRMHSQLPKALVPLCGRTLLDWVLRALPATPAPRICVVGYGAEQMKEHDRDALIYVEQTVPLGTGGALVAARPHFAGRTGKLLVVACDMPMLKAQSLRMLTDVHAPAAFLTTMPDDPEGYGRVQRMEGGAFCVLEARDLTAEQQLLPEARVSAYCFDIPTLTGVLDDLCAINPRGEITMGDIIMAFLARNLPVETRNIPAQEALGVNDRAQLAACATAMRARINRRHMRAGVTMIDPAATYIDDTVKLGADCTLYPNVVLEGNTVVDEGTTLYPGCRLNNSHFGRGCAAQAVVANDAVVGNYVTLGPYVNLRPGTHIHDYCKIGNYIEVKNSNVGEGTKLPHLSYIGDSDFGKRVNAGCGTVTVNYDGFKKHRTIIEDDVFIGCNTSLVAPVRVGEGAFTAAGSTITEDVPAQTLAIARARQVNKVGYVARLKAKRGET